MNGVMILRTLLLSHAPVSAIVGSQVAAGVLRQGSTLPAVGIREISRVEEPTVSNGEAKVLVRARIQVTAFAKSYPDQKALLQAIKLGAGTYTGTIAGVSVLSVTRDSVGPDLSDEAAEIYEQSRDFKVAYLEAN